MKKIGVFAYKFIQLLVIISIIAFSVSTKYIKNTIYFDQQTSLQSNNWEEASFEEEEDFLIEFFNPFTPILPLIIQQKISNQFIRLANHFPEIVIPPPQF